MAPPPPPPQLTTTRKYTTAVVDAIKIVFFLQAMNEFYTIQQKQVQIVMALFLTWSQSVQM